MGGDKIMQNYKAGNKVHVLESTDFEHLLPDGAVKISQAAADALNKPIPETPAQASARKDAQVNAEFTPAMIALERARDPINADGFIAAAKASRKQEL